LVGALGLRGIVIRDELGISCLRRTGRELRGLGVEPGKRIPMAPGSARLRLTSG
jgi:hypothetical protein